MSFRPWGMVCEGDEGVGFTFKRGALLRAGDRVYLHFAGWVTLVEGTEDGPVIWWTCLDGQRRAFHRDRQFRTLRES